MGPTFRHKSLRYLAEGRFWYLNPFGKDGIIGSPFNGRFHYTVSLIRLIIMWFTEREALPPLPIISCWLLHYLRELLRSRGMTSASANAMYILPDDVEFDSRIIHVELHRSSRCKTDASIILIVNFGNNKICMQFSINHIIHENFRLLSNFSLAKVTPFWTTGFVNFWPGHELLSWSVHQIVVVKPLTQLNPDEAF